LELAEPIEGGLKVNWEARKRSVLLVALVLCFGGPPLCAQNSGETKTDYPGASREIQSLEIAINGAIQRTFSGPFGLVSPPIGGYLPGYGYVFNFVVNIKRGMTSTPFGMMKTGEELSPEEKTRRIDGLKDELVRILLNSGNGFVKLQKNESIAIMAYFEEFNPLIPEGKETKTLILSVSKSDLSDLANRQDRYNEFKQKVKIVEYSR
jgi:hypothetical protein